MIAMTPKPQPPMETRSSCGVGVEAGPVAGEKADGMRALPEKGEAPPLHEIEQGIVGKSRGKQLRQWISSPALTPECDRLTGAELKPASRREQARRRLTHLLFQKPPQFPRQSIRMDHAHDCETRLDLDGFRIIDSAFNPNG